MKTLIADDDPVTCSIVRETLEKEGYDVITASNGAEAWRMLQEDAPPRIVILDWMIPEMNGLEVCRRIHERFEDAPPVFTLLLTGKGNPDDIVAGFDAGADDYITKPFYAQELLARVRVGARLVTMQALLAGRVLLAEHRHRKVIEHAVDGIFHTTPDGRCILVNPALVRMLGYASRDELRACMPSLLDLSSARYEELMRALQIYGMAQGFEIQLPRKDGGPLWVFVTMRRMYRPDGKPAGYEGTVQDISKRKQVEEALRDANRRLENALNKLRETQQQVIQQERLSALGQIASGIVHDFNNNLTPIKGYCNLLLKHPESLENRERLIESLQLIHTGAANAENVVRRLREFYRSREPHELFIPVDLNKLVREAVSLAQPKWKDQALAGGVTIRIRTDLGDIPPLAGKTADLREVLINLIFNAVDAIHDRGTITLRSRYEPPYIVLEVSDTGEGMSEETRNKCLEPFFSTKGEEGTGLGLATAWGIIKRHDGVIEIMSALGQGATFRIRLPAYTMLDTEDIERDEKDGEVNIPPLRILFVEDDPVIHKVVMILLMNDGHTLEIASNGSEGLSRIQRRDFDLVITDQAMPEMSGAEMAAEIKRIHPRMPILMLTGFGDLMKVTGQEPGGVDAVVSKPVTLDKLRSAMARVWSAFHPADTPDDQGAGR